MSLPQPGRRIIVVGTSGSGKTTLARQLAHRLGISHIELDAFNWGPEWTMVPLEQFRAEVANATESDTWVVDGNYRGRLGDFLWLRADTLVWLDYTLAVILWRLWWRTLRRVFLRETLWNGNREPFTSQFLTKDSLFLYAIQSHARRRNTYTALLTEPQYAHLSAIRLRAPRQAQEWLSTIPHRSHMKV